MAAKKKKSRNTKKNNTNNMQKTQVSKKEAVEKVVTADKAEVKKSTEKKTSKKIDKNKKPNIFKRFVDFIKSVGSELKKVNWLTKEELTKNTSVVAGIVAIFTVMAWIVDSGLGALAALLIN